MLLSTAELTPGNRACWLGARQRLGRLLAHLVPNAAAAKAAGGGIRRPLTILHTGDLHLCKDRKNTPDDHVKNKLALLGSIIAERGVDVLLIAGDIFDEDQIEKHHVQNLLETLRSFDLPVILMSGNHDGALLSNLGSSEWPENVQLLLGDQGDLAETADLVVWGKSIREHTPAFRPLHGVPARQGGVAKWFVVMGHGLFSESSFVNEGRSSLITAEEIASTDCDYVALGHVHAFRDCSQGAVPAFYCGSPNKDTAPAPTAALVQLQPGEAAVVERIDFEAGWRKPPKLGRGVPGGLSAD